MAEQAEQIGTITHFFQKAGVAVVNLSADLAAGERVRIEGKGVSFEQTVTSMQVNHVAVTTAKKGDAIGLKVDAPVKEGMLVFRA